MSNFYLDRLYTKQQREKAKKEQQAPPPAESSSLGAAIEQLIDNAVEERVADALEKQRPAHNPAVPRHLREFTDEPFRDTFPPPAPMAKPVKDLTVHLQRGADDKVKSVSIGTVNFVALRDGAGKLIGMRQES